MTPTPRNRPLALLASVLATCLLMAEAASAYFVATGATSTSAPVGAITAPGNPIARQSGDQVTVSWEASTPSGGGTAQGYRVTRSDDTPICGATTPTTALSCTDDTLPSSAVTYTITAIHHGFTKTTTTGSVTALEPPTISAFPPAVTSQASASFAFGAGPGGIAQGWGQGAAGQLGNGAASSSTTPVAVSQGEVPAGTTFTQIATGTSFSVALSSTGKVYAWGNGSAGQIGNGSTASPRTPTAVSQGAAPAGTTFTQVAAGGIHAVALSSAGKLYTWGGGSFGQLGNGSTTNSSVPVAVSQGAAPAGTTYIQVASGSNHVVALSSAGKLYAWGLGGSGQLGTGSSSSATSPVAVSQGAAPAGTTYTQFGAGANHAVALTSTGKLYAWGLGSSGQLGHGLSSSAFTPVAVSQGAIPEGTTFRQFAGAANHTVALSSTGKLYAWGLGTAGQLGNGSNVTSSTPVAVAQGAMPTGTTVTRVGIGANHTLALTSTGDLYAWGAGSFGQLGHGSTSSSTTPVAVSQGGTAYAGVASGPSANHTLAIVDVPAGSQEYECRLDGEPFAACTSPQDYAGLSEGEHTFSVRTAGETGHSRSATHTWTVDTTPPSTTMTLDPPAPDGPEGWYTAAPSFTLASTDPGSGVKDRFYKLDGGATQTYTGPVTLPEGTHTVSYWSTDQAGNVETARDSVPIKVDSTGPQSASVYLADGSPVDASGAFDAVWGGGAPAYAAGRTGAQGDEAFSFAGSRFLTIDPALGQFGTDPFTIAFSFRSTSISGGTVQSLVSARSWCGNPVEGWFDIRYGPTSVGFEIGNSGGVGVNLAVGTDWHDVVATRTATSFSLTVDGITATQGAAGPSSVMSARPVGINTSPCINQDSTRELHASVDGLTITRPIGSGTTMRDAAGASLSSGTVYFKGDAPGAFTLANTLVDLGSGVGSLTFPAIGATGWTHDAETLTAGTRLGAATAFGSSSFSWVAGASTPADYTLQARDIAGSERSGVVSFVNDTAAPAGGALTVNGVG
ncbi:RCC1 domain-containing protein, partial [Paraconexibacter sp.]|uniref:RCC1 domain-containing protein n=1 Tax=Paraconexibacter sp. TaxID=2949640 RepID=UPI0035641F23